MKNFARIIAPLALFALASLAAVACSDPEIEHYANPSSDVYLDKLLGIEGALENADSLLFAMAKENGCSVENDSGETVACYNRRDTAATVECMFRWIAAHEDSLLDANAPVSSEKGSSADLSSAAGSSDSGSSGEGNSSEGGSSGKASSSSGEVQSYDCEQLPEWQQGVSLPIYAEDYDGERLCALLPEEEGSEETGTVFECNEPTACRSVRPGTNRTVWSEKGVCR